MANHLKRKLGTGLSVTCGQNTNQGGIYNYWGCPFELADKVINEINDLIEKGID